MEFVTREIIHEFKNDRGRYRVRWVSLNADNGPYDWYIERWRETSFPQVEPACWELIENGIRKQHFSGPAFLRASRHMLETFLIT